MYKIKCDKDVIWQPGNIAQELTDPKLKLSVNSAGSLSFNMLPTHDLYDTIVKMKSIITVYQDNKIIFKGRVYSDKVTFRKIKSVEVEGILAYFNDTIVRPYTFSGSVKNYLKMLIEQHNSQVEEYKQFKIGNITVTDPNDYIVRESSDYPKTWEEITNKLIDLLGGYIVIRYEVDGNYIDYLADFDHISSQSIKYSVNLLDLTNEVKCDSLATCIIPLGATVQEEGSEESYRVDIKTVNGGKDYIYNDAAEALYGRITKVVVWDDVTEPSNLLTKAKAYLNNAILLEGTLTIKAIDLHLTDDTIVAFMIGYYVEAYSEPHGINEVMLITNMEIPLADPINTTLTVGRTKKSFTDTQFKNNVVSGQIEKVKNDIDKINVGMSKLDSLITFKFGICTTNANVAQKIVDLSDFVLKTGIIISVRFENGNTVSDITLNVNETGAKPISINNNGATADEAKWKSGDTVVFVYDGTAYQFLGSNSLVRDIYDASKVATNYINYDNGLIIGNLVDEQLGKNVYIDADSVDIRMGDMVLASYGEDTIYLGKNNKQSVIDFCDNTLTMYYENNLFRIETTNPDCGVYISNQESTLIKSEYVGNDDETGKMFHNQSYVNVQAGHYYNNCGDAEIELCTRSSSQIYDEENDQMIREEYETYIYMFKNYIKLIGNLYMGTEYENNTEIVSVDDDLNIYLGKGSYDDNIGSTNLYGSKVNILSKNGLSINGREYGVNKVLASPAWYMKADQTVNLSEPVSSQPHGIVLVWSAYTSGEGPKNYDWYFGFVPKYHINIANGSGCFFINPYKGMCKYVYIHNTKIVGNSNNYGKVTSNGISYDGAKYVLRYVVGV